MLCSEEAERLWVWHYEENKYYMDVGEPIRLRVHNIEFNRTLKQKPALPSKEKSAKTPVVPAMRVVV